MQKVIGIICVIVLGVALIGCHKDGTNGDAYPSIGLLRSHLMDGPWQFYSATISYPSGSSTRYVGNSRDTVIFNYGYDGAIVPTNITSYLRGLNDNCRYTIKMDSTIICAPAWRQYLSDTMKVTYFTDYMVVLQIKHISNVGEGIEIDTLKKIRFWTP